MSSLFEGVPEEAQEAVRLLMEATDLSQASKDRVSLALGLLDGVIAERRESNPPVDPTE
jgi:hypothetical protein